MNKIQIFAAPTIKALQSEINEWMADNKDAHIVETNITSLAKSSVSAFDEKKKGYMPLISCIPRRPERRRKRTASFYANANRTDRSKSYRKREQLKSFSIIGIKISFVNFRYWFREVIFRAVFYSIYRKIHIHSRI
ncbi:hypothetical protein SAMN04488084_11514 [Pedobacter antarcticus]|nr:hypothetical protein SAMN04488084_11514 [Pedobacter antarcticus]